MPTDPKLETYLAQMEKALGPISVSDRADILTEIRSHVLSAQEKDPSQSISSILASLGEPEVVANRYLLERGLKPGRPPRSPMIKWLTIGFLGTASLVFLMVVFVIWRFTPVLSVDDKNERVSILGGMISVDGKNGRVTIGSKTIKGNSHARNFTGEKAISSREFDSLRIPFTNGSMDIATSADNRFVWQCKVDGAPNSAFLSEESRLLIMDFSSASAVNCKLQIPAGFKTAMEGDNGNLRISKPAFDLDVNLDNGKIQVAPSKAKRYHYDFNVTNGQVDNFVSSDAADALKMKISLENGQISKSD